QWRCGMRWQQQRRGNRQPKPSCHIWMPCSSERCSWSICTHASGGRPWGARDPCQWTTLKQKMSGCHTSLLSLPTRSPATARPQ
ncbi:unnamed protein product, partial [Closterium sp. NIES-53]